MEKAVENLKRSEALSHYGFRSYRPHGFEVKLGPPRSYPAVPSDLVRFEDVELDAQRYSLRRSGRNLKLERIPMELLLFLVERRGLLVTREEIIEKLWGKDVFLDTDNSINTAIRKIRQALKDDPEQPRFVQTVAGKGYRFIAPIVPADEPAGSGASRSDFLRNVSYPSAA
jgi:DNA-binding winged helix-turn-helix (wHTH) protein